MMAQNEFTMDAFLEQVAEFPGEQVREYAMSIGEDRRPAARRDEILVENDPLFGNQIFEFNVICDRIDQLNREQVTELRLSLSLCPLHGRDYAICFDDEDPECESIRTIHPSFDS